MTQHNAPAPAGFHLGMMVQVGVLCAAVVMPGCGRENPRTHLEWTTAQATFGDVFERVERITLNTPEDAPLGFAADAKLWNGDLAVADGFASNVKIFSAAGTYLRTVGRLGDGPGELRRPVALTVSPQGDLVVLDSRMRLTAYGKQGELLRAVTLPGGRPQAVVAVDGDYLISARLSTDPTATWGAYLVNGSGKTLRHYHRIPTVEKGQRFRNNFLDVRALALPDRVVSLDQTENVVVWTFGPDGHVDRLPIDAPWYAPPAWPDGDTGLEALTKWGNTTRWGRTLLALGRDRVLVGFSAYQGPAGSPDMRYAVVDFATDSVWVLTDPAPARFTMTDADTLYDVHVNDDGVAVADKYVQRRREPLR